MAISLTPQEEADALLKGSSDIKFLFAREAIDQSLQAMFFHVGITTMARFAAVAKDEQDIKKMLRDDFGLDATADLASRVKVAGVLVAFKAAQSRSERVTEIEGEMSAKRLQNPWQLVNIWQCARHGSPVSGRWRTRRRQGGLMLRRGATI